MKKLIALVSVLCIICFWTVNANACSNYFDYNCHYLVGGVGNWGNNNRYYYVDSSASAYSTLIQNAVDSWVYTSSRLGYGTPISISKTTSKDYSVFDFYYEEIESVSAGVLGVTIHYNYGTQISANVGGAPNQNWTWARIELNSPSFSTISSQNGNSATKNKQGTIAHELGHALGLNHCTYVDSNGVIFYNTGRIMSQLASGRSVYQPVVADLQIINHLY